MHAKIMKILFLFLVFLLCCCCQGDKSNIKKMINNNVNILSDIFSVSDSCYLDFPLEYFPSIIYDVAINNDYIYIAGQSKEYPIMKFKKDGSFINTIGRIGGGPGEYLTSPTKLSLQNDNLAVLLPEFNKIILFKKDNFLIEKYFSKKHRFSDLDFINDTTLIASGYGTSDKHLFLMDTNLNLLATYVDIPEEAKKSSLISTHGWGIQCNGNNLLSHFLYPNFIVESLYNSNNWLFKINSKPVKLEKFQTIDSTKSNIIESIYSTEDRIEFFESFSKLYWIINTDDYYIGTYFYYGLPIGGSKVKIRKLRLFVIQNNNSILEFDLDNNVGFLVPHKNTILSCNYIEKSNDIMIRFSQLSFIKDNLLSK